MKTIYLLLLTLSIVALCSCGSDGTGNYSSNGKGAIKVNLPSSSRALPLPEDIARYELILESLYMETQTRGIAPDEPIMPGQEVVFEGLAQGFYTLRVEAFDADERLIFIGLEEDIQVFWATITYVTVEMKYADGTIIVDFVFPDPADLPWAKAYPIAVDFTPAFSNTPMNIGDTNYLCGVAGGNDLVVVRLDNIGNPLSQDYFRDSAGGTMIASRSVYSADGSVFLIFEKSGGERGFMKVNASGDIGFARSISDMNVSAFKVNIMELRDGGFLLAAVCDGSMILKKFSSDGTLLKTGTLSISEGFTETTYFIEINFMSIFEDGEGNIIIAVDSDDASGFGRVAVIKTSSNFEGQWVKFFHSGNEDSFVSLLPSSAGGLYVAGNTLSFPGGTAASRSFLIKLNNSGEIEWQRNYIYGHVLSMTGLSLAKNGRLFIAGFNRLNEDDDRSTFCLVLEADGKIERATQYSGFGMYSASLPSGFVLFSSLDNSGMPEGIIYKTDYFGNIPGLAEEYGGNSLHYGYIPVYSQAGNFSVAIDLEGEDISSAELTPEQLLDYFFEKISPPAILSVVDLIE